MMGLSGNLPITLCVFVQLVLHFGTHGRLANHIWPKLRGGPIQPRSQCQATMSHQAT